MKSNRNDSEIIQDDLKKLKEDRRNIAERILWIVPEVIRKLKEHLKIAWNYSDKSFDAKQLAMHVQ